MKAIVLAAGKGKRLHSEEFNLPKVLRKALGRPLISYVLDNISFIPEEDIVIVVGYKKEKVMEEVKGGYSYVYQDEQIGTGHAVMKAHELLAHYEGDVLVLYGDMPLFTKETLKSFVDEHKRLNSLCTVMTAVADAPLAYGRIIRDEKGCFKDIVELKDCSPEQAKINELNVGAYVFDSKTMFENLNKIKNNNNQGEYYLTDMPRILLNQGIKVNTFKLENSNEIYGVNTLEELEFCEKVLDGRNKAC